MSGKSLVLLRLMLSVIQIQLPTCQAEAMVTEWKELLWDVREERAALWSHCQSLFIRHSYPPIRVIAIARNLVGLCGM